MNSVRVALLSRVLYGSSVLAQRVSSGSSKLGPHKENGRPASVPSNVVLLGVDDVKVKARPSSPSLQNLELIRRVKECPRHRKPEIIALDSLRNDVAISSAIELHPEVFACNPRIDFIYLCKEWQSKYREVDYSWKPTRAEVGRGRKKPWPQKGTGRARHGSRVAPQWKGGGVAHGPRGPRPLYQKILPHVRLKALTSTLTIKFHQQDLSVVDNLDVSSPEPENLKEILQNKGITGSALIVHSEDDCPEGQLNICAAVEHLPDINLMPVVGLNVWSLLHHDRLILTMGALEEVETKVVWNLHKYNWVGKPHNFYHDLPFKARPDPKLGDNL